jgi:lambda family phage portal protein
VSSQLALPLGHATPAAAPAGASRAKASTSTLFEAGSTSRRTRGWYAPTSSPNAGVLGNLALLRDRSRQAVRNDGFAKGVIDALVANIVGTGIKPLSLAQDKTIRPLIHKLWLAWTDYSDADGLLDWYGQEAQAVRCWLEAGEVFVRRRDRYPTDPLPVPLQYQVIEPELCPHGHNSVTPSGNRIRAGIEFDKIGRRVAYWFLASRPGDLQDWNPGDLRRVPADQVLHVFKPLRAGQLRGIPHLTQALVRLWELDKLDDAVLLRQQLSNMFVAFLKRAADPSAELVGVLGDAAQADTSTDGTPALGFEPGLFQELEPGEEVDYSEPPDPPLGLADFMKGHLRAVGAATGVPYEVLTGDMSGLNDRVMRVILHEFRRRIQAEQHQTVAFQLCRPVWRAFLDTAFLAGALPIPPTYLVDPGAWAAVRWMPQGWPYLHPVQDVQAAQAAIRAGFTSRSAVVSEQGEDAEVVDGQQAEDNARADRLGLRFDSDGRQAKASAGAPGGEPPVVKKREPGDDDPDAEERGEDDDQPTKGDE